MHVGFATLTYHSVLILLGLYLHFNFCSEIASIAWSSPTKEGLQRISRELLPNATAGLFFFNMFILVVTAYHWLNTSLMVLLFDRTALRRRKRRGELSKLEMQVIGWKDGVSILVFGPVSHFNMAVLGRELIFLQREQ